MHAVIRPARRTLAELRRNRAGLALLEFALTMPILLFLGVAGIELANYAVAHLRVSQVALALADNASRVGERTQLASQELREVDLNDILQGVRLQSDNLDLTERGRITLSSLEGDADGNQRIHWQRCIGMKSGAGWDSSYGKAPVNGGTDLTPATAGRAIGANGMGPAGRKINAPPNSGVMYVEVNYDYLPIIDRYGLIARKIHYTASFIVRDNRDFRQVWNTDGAERATCDKHTA